MQIPLAIMDGSYDSIKDRGRLVNMITETNRKGDFLSVKRSEGLTLFDGSLTTPMRSNIHKNSGFNYFVSGANLYRFSTGAPVDLGVVGGSGRATIVSNAKPGDNQVMILNGSGEGYIYDSLGLTQIVDPDFYPTTSVTVLSERFWCVRDGTIELFASDISNGRSYNPLSFISAEYKPDPAVIAVSKQSALWSIGTQSIEYFQSVSDSLVPVRSVRGYAQDIGIQAKTSFAEIDNQFAFLSDDSTVVLFSGTQYQTISDLEFELRVRGDGDKFPGFTEPEIQSCIGFFVDTPNHRFYCLSFPDVNYTWVYDVNTGLSSTRESGGAAWRANYAITSSNVIYMGDRLDGSLWILDPTAKDENGAIQKVEMDTPTISFNDNVFIPLIEIDMEVGVAESPGDDPQMMVSYTKDGGKTYINHSPVSLGGWGDYRKRVVLRSFGRLVRHKDFGLSLSVTDAVRVQFYGIEAKVEASI